MLNTVNVNDTLYYLNPSTFSIERCTLLEIDENLIKVQMNAVANEDGTDAYPSYGDMQYAANFLTGKDALFFTNLKEAIKIKNQRLAELKTKYEKKITTFEELLDFPLNHQIYGENYDDIAREVYIEKCKSFKLSVKFKIWT